MKVPAYLVVAALAGACGANQGDIVLLPDRTHTPPDIREACTLAEQKCSRCHDLERIRLAHWALVNWDMYVDRMRRQPGSGISADDGKIILRCLQYIRNVDEQQSSFLLRPRSSTACIAGRASSGSIW